jgi:hypothetical protein
LGCRSSDCGAGIGSETACEEASGAGLSMVLSFGSSPTLAKRLNMLQALSVKPISRMRAVFRASWTVFFMAVFSVWVIFLIPF